MENKIKKSLHLDLGLLDAQDATKSNKHLDINKEMTFGEVLGKYPSLAEVFWEEGMHCVGCQYADKESIEDGCMMHGINVDKLLEKLNKKIKGGKH
jgi:hydroxylamine reductase